MPTQRPARGSASLAKGETARYGRGMNVWVRVARWRELRLAVREYLHRLSPRLLARYGRRKYYTPGQVSTTASIYRLNPRHLAHAEAIFCSPAALAERAAAPGTNVDYGRYRQQVGTWHFGGNLSFSSLDAHHVAAAGLFGGLFGSHAAHRGGDWGDDASGHSYDHHLDHDGHGYDGGHHHGGDSADDCGHGGD